MSKKHSRKLKSTRKRVPVTAAEEERYFQSKLAQLKEEMSSLEEHPTETKAVKKKSKKEATKVAKKGKAKVEEKVTKKAAPAEEVGTVTAKDLADALGLTPLLLRKKLRNAGMEKPEGGRWEWPEDHPDVDTILGWKNEEEPEAKPAKKEKAEKPKRGKKKAEPVVEEVEEDEEDEEEEEDEEGIDLEAMTLKELRELCDDEGIEYTKKDKKAALIEMLLDSEE